MSAKVTEICPGRTPLWDWGERRFAIGGRG